MPDDTPDYIRDAASDGDVVPTELPAPASEEDRAALTAITAEHARFAAKAEQLFALASPPPALLTALADDLARQIANFERQKDMIAGRQDLAAFPVKLDRVLADFGYYRRRAQALQMHLETQAMPWLVAREPGGAVAPAAAPSIPAAPVPPHPPVPSAPPTTPQLAPGVPMPAVNEWAAAKQRLDERQRKLDEEFRKRPSSGKPPPPR